MTLAKKVVDAYKLPLYIMIRPFKGFYAMKHEGQGTIKLALFNFLLVCISVSFSNQYAAIVVNPRSPRMINSFEDFTFLSIALVLFCVSNWAVTSLTDGEGRFKDIVMAVCYSMTPIVLTLIPAALISNILTIEEAAFYFMAINVAMFWFVILTFAGLVTVHGYTAAKAVLTIFLTFIALLIIVFLITLVLTLWSQMLLFVRSVYTEIVFRV